MKINSLEAYRRALGQANQLRNNGATVESNSELAELEGAIAAYSLQSDEPDESKGKPTPDPYGKD